MRRLRLRDYIMCPRWQAQAMAELNLNPSHWSTFLTITQPCIKHASICDPGFRKQSKTIHMKDGSAKASRLIWARMVTVVISWDCDWWSAMLPWIPRKQPLKCSLAQSMLMGKDSRTNTFGRKRNGKQAEMDSATGAIDLGQSFRGFQVGLETFCFCIHQSLDGTGRRGPPGADPASGQHASF